MLIIETNNDIGLESVSYSYDHDREVWVRKMHRNPRNDLSDAKENL